MFNFIIGVAVGFYLATGDITKHFPDFHFKVENVEIGTKTN